MPSNASFKVMNAAHRVLLKISRGRAGWRMMDMPVLELVTTGRRSGQPRAVLLSVPVQDGSTLVVVASRGGDDRNPGWYLNLREQPDVEVALAGAPRQRMRAHIATAEQRSELWPRIVAEHKNYAQYQTKTSREIPLVLLEPAR